VSEHNILCYCVFLCVAVGLLLYGSVFLCFHCVLLYVTMCYCVLLCVGVTVCCCVLLYVTVCYSVLLSVCYCMLQFFCVFLVCYCMLMCVTLCYCVLLCYCVVLYVTVCHSVLLCVTCVALCYCVLKYNLTRYNVYGRLTTAKRLSVRLSAVLHTRPTLDVVT
jgi:hypothetical protein